MSFDTVTWKGLTEFNGSDIWADAEGNIFYKDTYVLDTKTNTWVLKYWDITDNESITDNIKAENIWEDSTTETYFLTVLGAGSLSSRCGQDWFFLRTAG